jgi:hypothetical protein
VTSSGCAICHCKPVSSEPDTATVPIVTRRNAPGVSYLQPARLSAEAGFFVGDYTGRSYAVGVRLCFPIVTCVSARILALSLARTAGRQRLRDDRAPA